MRQFGSAHPAARRVQERPMNPASRDLTSSSSSPASARPAREAFRWLPAPLISLLLFVVWLMLNQSLSLGHVALAAVLAITVPWFSERLRPDRPRLKRPILIVRFGLLVLWDILKSNVEVARRILGPESAIRPRFVWVPLSIRDPHGIVSLAGVITMTPGTLSAEISDDSRHLLVHAFNVDDEAALIADIKARYEAPLMQIFD
jgi:multicomponent K+:H+ antiporter subunit E